MRSPASMAAVGQPELAGRLGGDRLARNPDIVASSNTPQQSWKKTTNTTAVEVSGTVLGDVFEQRAVLDLLEEPGRRRRSRLVGRAAAADLRPARRRAADQADFLT